jgi:hypothetical protein
MTRGARRQGSATGSRMYYWKVGSLFHGWVQLTATCQFKGLV